MSRPVNALGVSVLDNPAAVDAVLANSVVTLKGLPDFNWRDAVAYEAIVNSPGVLQISTATYAALPVVGQAYKIVIRPNFPDGSAELAEPQSETYIVIASTAVLADLTAALDAAIDANTLSKFTATSTATTVVITQKDFTIEGFTIGLATGSASITTGTPYTAPAGTPAIVKAAVPPGTTVGGAGYTTYIFTIDVRKYYDSAGDVTASHLQAIVYANTGGGTYGAFNVALTAIADGTATAAEYRALV